MRIEDFVGKYPRVFHMAQAATWAQIQRHGLLSTTALLDLFEVDGPARFEIESKRRPEIVTIEHPVYGRAQIRDNKPLREQFLSGCLDGMSRREWYELLNHKVFFWVDHERLEGLLRARAYRNHAHDVLTLDTAALLERHGQQVSISSINTGATRPRHQGGKAQATPAAQDPVGSLDVIPQKPRRRARTEQILAHLGPATREKPRHRTKAAFLRRIGTPERLIGPEG